MKTFSAFTSSHHTTAFQWLWVRAETADLIPMQALRWILGLTTALGTAGFLALVVFGDGFRRSYGASENGALKVGVTLIVQAALLASIAAPTQRILMHCVAGIVIGLMACSLWIYRESAFVGTTGVAYCGMWIGYYWQAVWGQR